MSKQTEALKLALEALAVAKNMAAFHDDPELEYGFQCAANELENAFKEALAQPAVTETHKQNTTCEEPVAWLFPDGTWTIIKAMADDHPPTLAVYASPLQRNPLTFKQVEACFPENAIFAEADGRLRVSAQTLHDLARNVESAHGITKGHV